MDDATTVEWYVCDQPPCCHSMSCTTSMLWKLSCTVYSMHRVRCIQYIHYSTCTVVQYSTVYCIVYGTVHTKHTLKRAKYSVSNTSLMHCITPRGMRIMCRSRSHDRHSLPEVPRRRDRRAVRQTRICCRRDIRCGEPLWTRHSLIIAPKYISFPPPRT